MIGWNNDSPVSSTANGMHDCLSFHGTALFQLVYIYSLGGHIVSLYR